MLDDQEKQVLVEFVGETMREKRRARRWTIFFRLVIVGILIAGLRILSSPAGIDPVQFTGPHTGLVRLEGPMFAGTLASAESVNDALRRAFKNEDAAAVILEINTPGGSPVQAARINDELQRLRTKYPDKSFHVVVSDICASGGMYVAVAADMIYADKASLVGSVGVIVAGFGLEEAIKKLGIERRLLTAGEHKAFLDPFSPENPTEIEHMQSVLDRVHTQFIARVKAGRGSKLADNPDVFSGLIWSGEQAKELGLIDDFGDVDYVAREVIKVEKVVEYKPRKSFLDFLTHELGKSMALWLHHIAMMPILK